MKLIELVNARTSLGKLVSQDLPIRTAYKLMQMTDECNKHLVFYGNELAKFNPDKNPERLRELDNMEIDFPCKTIVEMTDNLVLSAADVKLLSPIVEFVGGE